MMIEPGDLFEVNAPVWMGHILECTSIQHWNAVGDYSGCVDCAKDHHWVICAKEGAWCERWVTLVESRPQEPERNLAKELDEVRATTDATHFKTEKLAEDVWLLRQELEKLRNELTG